MADKKDSYICLRGIEDNEKDIDFIMNLRNDSSVAMALINRAEISNSESTREWIKRNSISMRKEAALMIEENDGEVSKKRIGYIKYIITDIISGVAEIGLCITKREQGKGWGKKATIEIIKYLSCTFGINKIVIEVLAVNQESLKLFEGLEFRRVGTLKNHFLHSQIHHDVIILEKEL